jgi:nucleoside-diphosphate-sugar epimerase
VTAPAGPAHAAARLVSKLPFLPQQLQWVEAASHPAIMDTTRARTELGWKPQVSAHEALHETVH